MHSTSRTILRARRVAVTALAASGLALAGPVGPASALTVTTTLAAPADAASARNPAAHPVSTRLQGARWSDSNPD